jgi:aryl-alcohol dehydrogenase-like predicted oxidoreductase
MEYRNLGTTGAKVSTLCLGAMTFGEADEKSFMHKVGADEATSHAIIERALSQGINFIDTADVYGQDGLSERVIGNWFDKSKKRDEIFLATKFRFPMGAGVNNKGGSRVKIMHSAEASLRRLKTDRIDLYQIHMQDIDTPEEETLRALDDLVRQGKVLYIGCSNYAAYRLTDSLWTAREKNLTAFATMQMQYSLVTRDIEREHVSVARKFGVGILPWSPLAAGFLTGKYHKGQAAPEGTRLQQWKDRFATFDNDRNWRVLAAVESVAKEVGKTPAQVSLAWLLAQPHVPSVIFGATSTKQLDDNIAAAELKLPPQALKQLTDASAFEIGYPYDFMRRTQERW